MKLLIRILLFAVVLCSPKAALAMDPQIARVVNGWREYEGVEVKGVVRNVREGREVTVKRFVICNGVAEEPKLLRPKSVATLVKNPGEPHIKDDEIVDFFSAYKDGVVCSFERYFMSSNTGADLSIVQVGSGNYIHGRDNNDHFLSVLDSIISSDILSFAPGAGAHGMQKKIEDTSEFRFAGVEVHAGIEGKIIEMRYKETSDPILEGLTFRTLVAFEPSVTVLKYLDATGSNVQLVKQINEGNRQHRIKKFEIICDLLIPVVTEIGSDQDYLQIEIQEVRRLPSDFHGLWEFDGPSGTSWFGDLEPSIRKAGLHVRHPLFGNHRPPPGAGTQIPFTENEEEAIRQYFVAKGMSPTPNEMSWMSLLFYISSVAVLLGASLLFYRKVKGNF